MVNAHLHSHDHFNKGSVDNLLIELYLLYLKPFFSHWFNRTKMILSIFINYCCKNNCDMTELRYYKLNEAI